MSEADVDAAQCCACPARPLSGAPAGGVVPGTEFVGLVTEISGAESGFAICVPLFALGGMHVPGDVIVHYGTEANVKHCSNELRSALR